MLHFQYCNFYSLQYVVIWITRLGRGRRQWEEMCENYQLQLLCFVKLSGTWNTETWFFLELSSSKLLWHQFILYFKAILYSVCFWCCTSELASAMEMWIDWYMPFPGSALLKLVTSFKNCSAGAEEGELNR